MLRPNKALGIIVALIVAASIFFYDNLAGYFRFRSVCASESGLRIEALVEPGVGWRIGGGNVAETRFPVSISGVGFVRYRSDKDGALYDVFSVRPKNIGDDGYAQVPANLNIPTIYEYRREQKTLKNEVRMFQVTQSVVDLRSGVVAITYKSFGYNEFDPARTLLAAPSLVMCPADELKRDEANRNLPSKVEVAFSSIFKKQ